MNHRDDSVVAPGQSQPTNPIGCADATSVTTEIKVAASLCMEGECDSDNCSISMSDTHSSAINLETEMSGVCGNHSPTPSAYSWNSTVLHGDASHPSQPQQLGGGSGGGDDDDLLASIMNHELPEDPGVDGLLVIWGRLEDEAVPATAGHKNSDQRGTPHAAPRKISQQQQEPLVEQASFTDHRLVARIPAHRTFGPQLLTVSQRPSMVSREVSPSTYNAYAASFWEKDEGEDEEDDDAEPLPLNPAVTAGCASASRHHTPTSLSTSKLSYQQGSPSFSSVNRTEDHGKNMMLKLTAHAVTPPEALAAAPSGKAPTPASRPQKKKPRRSGSSDNVNGTHPGAAETLPFAEPRPMQTSSQHQQASLATFTDAAKTTSVAFSSSSGVKSSSPGVCTILPASNTKSDVQPAKGHSLPLITTAPPQLPQSSPTATMPSNVLLSLFALQGQQQQLVEINDYDVILGDTHTRTLGTRVYRQVRQQYAKRNISLQQVYDIKKQLTNQLQPMYWPHMHSSSPQLLPSPRFWYSVKSNNSSKQRNKIQSNSIHGYLATNAGFAAGAGGSASKPKRGCASGAAGSNCNALYGLATDKAIQEDVRNAPKVSRTRKSKAVAAVPGPTPDQSSSFSFQLQKEISADGTSATLHKVVARAKELAQQWTDREDEIEQQEEKQPYVQEFQNKLQRMLAEQQKGDLASEPQGDQTSDDLNVETMIDTVNRLGNEMLELYRYHRTGTKKKDCQVPACTISAAVVGGSGCGGTVVVAEAAANALSSETTLMNETDHDEEVQHDEGSEYSVRVYPECAPQA